MANRTKLEKLADIGTIISAFSILGVIAAFNQINDSNKQFKTEFTHEVSKDSIQRVNDSLAKIEASNKAAEEKAKTKADIDRLNNQFLIENQSYLLTDLIIKEDYPDIAFKIEPTTKVKGLHFAINISNTGNMAMRYTVVKFDILFNGKIVQKLRKNIYPIGILYRNQWLTFGLDPIEENDLPHRLDPNEKKISCKFVIKYNDYGSSHNKFVRRKYDIMKDSEGHWTSSLTKINDDL